MVAITGNYGVSDKSPLYELVCLTDKSSETKFLDALTLYNGVTNITSKTDSDQISYWKSRYNKENSPNKLYIFSFTADSKLIGFAMAMYIFESRFLIIDHIAIDKQYIKNSVFFTFIEMIRDYAVSNCGDITAMIVEIMKDDGEQQFGISYEQFMRIFRVAGFKYVHIDHYIPNLNARDSQVELKARLLICPFGDMSVIQTQALKNIVKSVIFQHYGKWYMPFVENKEKYEAHLKNVYNSFESKISGKSIIQLNGDRTGLMYSGKTSNDIANAPYIFILLSTLIIGGGS